MTYQEMVDMLGMRLGGGQTLARLFPNVTEQDLGLTLGQSQVADEMVARFGYATVPNMDNELNEAGDDYEQNVPLAPYAEPIADGSDCLLPACYHMAVVFAAALLLANKMGDNMPTIVNPAKMFAEYQQALKRGHKVHALTLYSQTPDRILDGYKPLRHYEEEL